MGHHLNDDMVSLMGSREVVTKDAYVIFLIRRAKEGQQVRRQSVTLPDLWPHWVSNRNSVLLDLVPGREGRSLPSSSNGDGFSGLAESPKSSPRLRAKPKLGGKSY